MVKMVEVYKASLVRLREENLFQDRTGTFSLQAYAVGVVPPPHA